jgi:uncharacterized protein YaiI (UPF0178 family)
VVASEFTIWADADALPGAIRDILVRAAERTRSPLILVANKRLRVPWSRFVRLQQVNPGADVADGHIVRSMQPGDLVVTADIPLADAVVKGGGIALDPRGEVYDEASIGERLAMRNLMQDLRERIQTAILFITHDLSVVAEMADARAKQDFANALDRLLRARERD